MFQRCRSRSVSTCRFHRIDAVQRQCLCAAAQRASIAHRLADALPQLDPMLAVSSVSFGQCFDALNVVLDLCLAQLKELALLVGQSFVLASIVASQLDVGHFR